MDFDLSQIDVPFRMQPGLRRIPNDQVRLTPLAPATALYAEKKAVVDAGQSRHQLPGFDPTAALDAISALATRSGIDPELTAGPLELAFEEDLAILDGTTGTVPWLCVCVPSHWAPEDKLGLDFADIHRPVADNAALLSAARHLVSLVTGGGAWERFVWTLTPSPRHDQHPRRHPRTSWDVGAGDEAVARQCHLRVERQFFIPVGRGTVQAVFGIHVMLQPLELALATAGAARRLHDALASMSPAVLAYRNLDAAREPLLRWLAARG